ncbi:AMP-binding protein [Bacteroides sp.]|uniref:AMP-binding protein n=3 Tax=Bacteroides sp. TaxID=29523 RepID=UPI001B7788FD|nr:AMP-binding protein [Bacteroides sp.]MBP6065540.1 AMP-binding protein [Bacteroides sp.]MBP6067633.1 AMP-binding protein [Bacteroides sp.]MBP6936541.1 AMP-binding protein [Bacteroides sp.]MBP8622559.1 AMP-binding protein [Bacteroides sp.]MBP9507219.1 AMP-binding protein [Bacteroides sp.]
MEQSFIAYIENSIKNNWDLDALTDYKGATLQYKDVARKIEKIHIIFEESGINKGDKIAVCGRNSSHWGVTFLATLTYGAVIVPILHEFKADNVHNIVNHSEAKLLFVGDMVWENLNEAAMPLLEGIIMMTDFTLLVSRTERLTHAREHLNEMFGKKFPKNFRQEHIAYHQDKPEELAVINYTSGTTSYSKGVMLPYRSLWSNTRFAFDALDLKPGDRIVSMLPMAHMYGLAFEFIYEFAAGCQIFFLTRMPSPKIIFQAFEEVKPNLVVAVPLIIEKIIKKNILPKLETTTMRLLLKVPIINDKIRASVREKMVQAFGGNFETIIIGGAGFNQEVERFLRQIEFPYTVGYGMTECGPIICYEDWKTFKEGSCGKPVPRMEVKILSPDPETQVGEIVCRGDNMMLGYYKNEEATAEAIKDGWLHTGDLAIMDAEGNVTIKGRSKNMLLSSSGQNIYPEEIEDKLNNLPYVAESIIVQQNEKLVGLVYPDFDEAFAQGLKEEDLEGVMEENRITLNATLPAYSQIFKMKIYPEEFEKTPKKSIKRFLYQEAKG